MGAGHAQVFAQSFSFEQVNPAATTNIGNTFDVRININTGGTGANSGDALIIFDPTRLSVSSATDGHFFHYFNASPLGGAPTKHLVSGWEDPGHEVRSSSATLFSTLTLTVRSCGATTLAFDCTAGTDADTNINRATDSRDIVNCTQSLPITLNLCGGGTVAPTSPPTTPAATLAPGVPTPTYTPTPTRTPTPIRTPTPTVTPRPVLAVSDTPPGIMNTTVNVLGTGAALTIVGGLTLMGVLFIL